MDIQGTKGPVHIGSAVVLSLSALFLVGGAILGISLHKRITSLEARIASTDVTLTTMIASSTTERELISAQILQLSDGLYAEQKNVADLLETFKDVRHDVGKLSGSVETLEKISTTDPQLLQKYSSIYFLNENYLPADLEPIDEKYDLVNGKEVTIHAQVLPFLEDLLENAWDDGVQLLVLSGYRSFAEQTTLKQNYTTRYGSGANAFSADQGYSEHQLGTTVDFTDTTSSENLDLFAQTKSITWLKGNAYKYGFVMSYPENNEHYIYEPWHWRFVGKDLARYLNRNDTYLYALEQRKIDTYIPTLFDK